jgi:hypothetical protein
MRWSLAAIGSLVLGCGGSTALLGDGGDGGLALVFVTGSSLADRLFFRRTDLHGVPVGAPHAVCPDPTDYFAGSVLATEWADDRFGVLFGSSSGPFALRSFVAAE